MEYLVNEQNYGISLILNNVMDDNSSDLIALQNTLPKIGYNIISKKVENSQEIEDICLYVSQNIDHSEYASFLCILFAHQIEDSYSLISKDGTSSILDINKLIKCFSKSKTLKEKPKLFILQVNKLDNNILLNEAKLPCPIKINEDFLIVFSHIFQNSCSSSHFIQEFCFILENSKEELDICSILTRINRNLHLKQNLTSIVSFISCLRKKFTIRNNN